ncbi:hypothetical protein [Gracilibacillus dipsosauri]|uniref:Uncharacterized protein n=2 Tax=Bacillaceae TaxID=186817 RepID=A0A317KVN8_9BACI|nr:hypothetical protein [Gracilibacillus dipsosauri]PWU67572.1 hypothetical protein DLJ74_13995 [Gracilibacillus dipsosauri]
MMVKLIRTEMKRNLFTWSTLIAFLLFVALFVLGAEKFRPNTELGLERNSYNYFSAFLYTHGVGPKAILPIVFPFIIALLSGSSLALDRKTGYIEFILLRTTYKKYIFSKMIAASIISFLFVFIVEILCFLYLRISFHPPNSITEMEGYVPSFGHDLFTQSPFLYIFFIVLNTAILAVFISLLSILLATWSKNVYIVMFAPFFIFIIGQLLFFALHINKFAPFELVGGYMLNSFEYSLLELPIILLFSLLITSFLVYFRFSLKFKKGLQLYGKTKINSI